MRQYFTTNDVIKYNTNVIYISNKIALYKYATLNIITLIYAE